MLGEASSFSLPYQMPFSATSLAEDAALGFVFPFGTEVLNVYDPGDFIFPAGADNNPTWTPAPTTGQPPPSGGYYLRVRTGTALGVPTVLTVPAGLNARYVSGWYAFNGTGVTLKIAVRYDNGTVEQVVAGINSIGYAPFRQFSVLNPPVRPVAGSAPGTRITQLEFTNETDNDWYYITLDDLTFSN